MYSNSKKKHNMQRNVLNVQKHANLFTQYAISMGKLCTKYALYGKYA